MLEFLTRFVNFLNEYFEKRRKLAEFWAEYKNISWDDSRNPHNPSHSGNFTNGIRIPFPWYDYKILQHFVLMNTIHGVYLCLYDKELGQGMLTHIETAVVLPYFDKFLKQLKKQNYDDLMSKMDEDAIVAEAERIKVRKILAKLDDYN